MWPGPTDIKRQGGARSEFDKNESPGITDSSGYERSYRGDNQQVCGNPSHPDERGGPSHETVSTGWGAVTVIIVGLGVELGETESAN